MTELDPFTYAYLVCALWSTPDPDTQACLDARYHFEDFSEEAIRRAAGDCRRFQEENAELLVPFDSEYAGFDLWLTRNGHGSGYWSGDYPEPAGRLLTEAAKRFPEVDLYVGDDGKLYFQ